MHDLLPFLKLYGNYKGRLALGILLAFVTLIASLGLLSLSGWFITSTAIAGLTLTTAQTFNFFTPGAGVRGFSITRTAARYGERLLSHDATFRLLSGLRQWFFQRLMHISPQQLNSYRKGALLDQLVADVDALDQLYLRLLSPLVAAIVITVLFSLFLACFHVTVALTLFTIMTLWIITMPVLFYGLGRNTGASLGVRKAALRQQVLDYLQGMAEHQIYRHTATMQSHIARAQQALVKDQRRMSSLEGVGSALFVMGVGGAALLVMYIGSGALAAASISGPVMVMMVFGTMASFEALMPLPMAFQFLNHTRHAARRLKTTIDIPSIQYGEQACPEQPSLVFDDLHYRYDNGEAVLNGLSLTIPYGEHIALLGRTGCGKSTLIKLLSRSIEAQQGTVTLGGVVLADIAVESLYQHITFVSQKTHLFSATLRDNLQLANPKATDAELMTVVQQVGLHTVAAAQQDKQQNTQDSASVEGEQIDTAILDLWLGQGGVALSGGELRRLAIARALLKPAAILLLDEPSEGLDSHSEKHLLATVLTAYQSRTVVMITHKPAAVEQMHHVYRMAAGRLEQLR